ncbi:hypothetical protein [Persicitalea jodogahamensis]|nr:hypothetical protein [Persicitalea jodogahamensis]
MKKNFFWLAFWSVFLLSCADSNPSETAEISELKGNLADLSADQALMKIEVGGQDFYSDNLAFKTNVLMLPQSLKLGFLNEEGGNVEMEMIKDGWFDQKSRTFNLANDIIGETGGDQVIVMVGRLRDKMAMQGEGYFLVNGKVEVLELSRQFITIALEGNLVKPGLASTEENYVPVKGWIVVKEPDYTEQSSAELLKKIDEK